MKRPEEAEAKARREFEQRRKSDAMRRQDEMLSPALAQKYDIGRGSHLVLWVR